MIKKTLLFTSISLVLFSLEIEYSVSGGMNPERFEGFKKKYNLSTFIETGTFYGITTKNAAPYFDDIYTIELGKKLHRHAKVLLQEFKNIKCILGYSEIELEKLLKQRGASSTLIFLDAHYSGGATVKALNDPPVIEEIAVIGRYVKDDTVIILDDVRCFNSAFSKRRLNYYPLLSDIKKYVKKHYPVGFEFVVIGDQAVIYNPIYFNDEISEAARVFTDIYTENDQTRFFALSKFFLEVSTDKEKQEILKMANSPHSSHILCYIAALISKKNNNTELFTSYMKKASINGLNKKIVSYVLSNNFYL